MDKTRILAYAIGHCWPNESTPEIAEIEPALLAALRALDAASPAQSEQVRAQILHLVARLPTLQEEVQAEYRSLQTATERGHGTTPGAPPKRHIEVEVLFATDRQSTIDSDPVKRFGESRADAVSHGTVHVWLPDDHRMGRLPQPRPWPLRFSQLKDLHFTSSQTDDLAGPLTAMRNRAPGEDALVFIHGYSVTFASAARRAAQLAYDLDFAGVPVLYSWPSQGRKHAYIADGESAAASQLHFRSFLRDLMAATNVGRIHVLAHSMGNRLLTEALTVVNGYRLGQVIFAAPDVDSQVFTDRAREFAGGADRYTLYVSNKDLALAASKRLATYPRAGTSGPDVLVLKGIDTVDATELDTGFLSHTYVMEHRSVVADVYSLLRHNHEPAQRFGMQPVMSQRGLYWLFRP